MARVAVCHSPRPALSATLRSAAAYTITWLCWARQGGDYQAECISETSAQLVLAQLGVYVYHLDLRDGPLVVCIVCDGASGTQLHDDLLRANITH